MSKSETFGKPRIASLPRWVRYVVDVITGADEPWANMQSVMQGFSSRVAAERFARAMADRIPNTRTAGDCASAWVTVGAIHKSNASAHMIDHARVQWYRTIDHGGVVVKDHAIDAWFHGGKLPPRAADPCALNADPEFARGFAHRIGLSLTGGA